MGRLHTAEHIARRLLQIQKAIRSSPKAPTFDGLDAYLRHMPMASQAMRTPKFDAHVMETQKTEAFILKQARLEEEEDDDDE